MGQIELVWNYFSRREKMQNVKHKITKILVATKGCTKSMSNHIKTFHKAKPEKLRTNLNDKTLSALVLLKHHQNKS